MRCISVPKRRTGTRTIPKRARSSRQDALTSGRNTSFPSATSSGPAAGQRRSSVRAPLGLRVSRTRRRASNSFASSASTRNRRTWPARRSSRTCRASRSSGAIGAGPLRCTGASAWCPLTPAQSKFPNGYVMYQQGREQSIALRPVDPNIRQRDGFLGILAPPVFPKLGFDSHAGWFAYQMTNDLVFCKALRDLSRPALQRSRRPHDLDLVSARRADAGGGVGTHWPAQQPRAGRQRGVYPSIWWALENPFPKPGEMLDLRGLAATITSQTR